MTGKAYEWSDGAVLEDHSRRKHKILREYFFDYLTVRCRIVKMERFRLAIVDGFSGGGRYKCGTSGSPLIFMEELKKAIESVNTHRAVQGLKPIEIECLLILNDADPDAVACLRKTIAPLRMEIAETVPNLHLHIEIMNKPFEEAYPEIKELISRKSKNPFRNVIFNLDQCGHSRVKRETLIDIMRSYTSVEIFYTFAIESLITYLQGRNPERLAKQLEPFDISIADIQAETVGMSKTRWLGAAERMVFDSFRTCSTYVSPFSINNPDGWRYWLIHFANSYRARQVYNNLLHANSSEQAHYGLAGLEMLSYDPRHGAGSLYLFDEAGRDIARDKLANDIPKLVSETGNLIRIGDFYEGIYNATPAHSEDIHQSIIDNPDLEVITETGGERRRAKTIRVDDILRLKKQTSFYPLF